MAPPPPNPPPRIAPRAVELAWPALAWAQAAFLAALIVANLLFPLGLFLLGLPEPAGAFYGEESPINWFSSMQCAVLAVAGAGVWAVTLTGRRIDADPAGRSWPWFVLACGFAFLSADEQFMFHENVRDKLLVPGGFRGPSWIHPGDVVLLLYVVAGAGLALALVADLRRHRLPLLLFTAALGLIGVTAFQDSLNLRVLKSPQVRAMQIVLEETFEVWAQGLFGLSLILLFFRKLRTSLERLARSG
jgi:hypothetical protein